MTRLDYQEELQRLRESAHEELDLVARQLSLVIDALERGEEQDAVVDELNRACFSQAIEFGDSTERRAWATAMILVSRAFERIADNAVDIGAHLRFAVTGSFEASPGAPAA